MTVSVANAQADLVRSVNALYKMKETHASAVLADSDPVYDSYVSDNVKAALAAKDGVRKALVEAWDKGVTQLQSQMVEFARATGYPTASGTTADDALIAYVLDYLTDSGQFSGDSVSKKVTARGITRGTLNSPTGVQLYRLLYDHRAQPSQIGFAEAINARVATISTNASGTTVALQSEKSKGIDVFDAQGSGASQSIRVINETNRRDDLLAGPNLLTSGTDSATVTAFSNASWTLTGTWTVETTKKFRTLTHSAETAVDGSTFSQTMPSNLSPNVAYLPYIICNPTSQSSMDVRFDWGGQNETVSVGSDDAWSIITPTLDANLYPANFDSATSEFKVTVNLSGGSLVIARAGLIPFVGDGKREWFGTRWAALMTDTTPVLDAHATTTDTLSLSGKIADILAVAMNVSMPTTGTNTIADPS